jgi:hypothetical protein
LPGHLDLGSSNNLIGIGGSGGLQNGVFGNIVGVADPGLAPLGEYGGPTQTMALLPGSPAIGAGGTPTFGGVSTDQRGFPRSLNSLLDIGAFESQGFTLTPVLRSTPQSALTNSAFTDALAVNVTANNPLEPVDGGVVAFTAPNSGASAILSATFATIAGGQASVSATANASTGRYTVTASASGGAGAKFNLTNLVPASAAFANTNTTTHGNWIGTYGTDGYDIIGSAASIPSYAKVTPSGESTWTWAASTTDSGALQTPGGTSRIAAAWYSATSFTVDVNLTDGLTHDVELYFLDWGSNTRGEQVTLTNAATGAVLDTQTVSSFHSGVYLEWATSGNVLITITRTSGANAVLSGLFFAAPATSSRASAAFIGQNTTTQGNWIGTYGSQGYDIIGSTASIPGYATVTPFCQASWTWAASTSHQSALETANGSSHIAACWYSATSFAVDVNLTDGQTHDIELYLLDWGSNARGEQVTITNATTGAVLDTETVSSFHSGVYLECAVSGNVLFTITRTSGANAVLSGLFFDPASTPAAAALSTGGVSPGSVGAADVESTATASARLAAPIVAASTATPAPAAQPALPASLVLSALTGNANAGVAPLTGSGDSWSQSGAGPTPAPGAWTIPYKAPGFRRSF